MKLLAFSYILAEKISYSAELNMKKVLYPRGQTKWRPLPVVQPVVFFCSSFILPLSYVLCFITAVLSYLFYSDSSLLKYMTHVSRTHTRICTFKLHQICGWGFEWVKLGEKVVQMSVFFYSSILVVFFDNTGISKWLEVKFGNCFAKFMFAKFMIPMVLV